MGAISEPCVTLDYRVGHYLLGPWQGAPSEVMDRLVQRLTQVNPKDVPRLEERAVGLVNRFRRRVEEHCHQIGQELEELCGAEPRVFFIRSRERTNKFSLVLTETRDFLDDLVDEEELQNRYRSLLTTVLSLFRCHPERPSALLIAEALAPALDMDLAETSIRAGVVPIQRLAPHRPLPRAPTFQHFSDMAALASHMQECAGQVLNEDGVVQLGCHQSRHLRDAPWQ